MKVSRVQRPRSKVQSDGRAARVFSHFGRWALDIGRQPSRLGYRDGIALVITLIMLSIITFLAVTFLVLSQRERSSVTTAMDQKIARDTTDTAFARVSAELLARMMLHTNFQDFDLLVSTNYYNAAGFHPGSFNPTNVNYDYLDGGGFAPLTTAQDREANIANLLYDPRPPVYVVTNTATGQADFRYYLDLNRNGRAERNGFGPVIMTDNGGNPRYVTTNGVFVSTNLPIVNGTYLVTNYFVGDPEWIGVLARPWEPHSADNPFTSRYAFYVVPVGKTLDINTMHNQAFTKTLVTGNDGYMRNQGVGPWELNLPAFLTDLNTNIWPGPQYPGYNPANAYEYNRPFGTANAGLSFQDALSLLSYRYANDYTSLRPASQLFGTPAVLSADNIDEYSDGPIMTTTTNISEVPGDLTTEHWLGAENTNHFFSAQDLFDRNKTGFGTAIAPGFSGRLQQAGTSNDTYNAYTYYRMLAQLGTDSTPTEDKLNINYKNTDIHGNVVPGMETNHILWTPEDFFTNAANRMLSQISNDMGVALSTAYIPVYPTNYYTPAVHRALQLAANIFDATTNQTVPLVASQTNAFFPSVFRPVFTVKNKQVFISGYKEVVDITPLSFQFWDYATLTNQPDGSFVGINVYGVPWVVGAKKGLPNFNQFAYQTTYAFTRKLLFERTGQSGDISADYTLKQQFVMNVTNQVGMAAWNSYVSQWPMASRKLRLFATNIFSLRILNDTNPFTGAIDLINPQTLSAGVDTHPANWPGYNVNFPVSSFKVLIDTNNLLMNGDVVSYDPSAPGFRLGAHYNQPVVRPIPQFYMFTTNHVLYALIDESTTPNRIVDFVNLDDSGKMLDFTGYVEARARAASVVNQPYKPDIIWRTNSWGGPQAIGDISDGLDYQISASLGNIVVEGWNDTKSDPKNLLQIQGLNQWLLKTKPLGETNGQTYTPTIMITNQVSWEANDPLVHYTIPDLTDAQPIPNEWAWKPGKVARTHRYAPWDGPNVTPTDSGNLQVAIAKKDPAAFNSDAWDFPTNKFWNVGILGRVHRGTPWQTVYMKSPVLQAKDWASWSGNLVMNTNPVTGRTNADAITTFPVADYQLFDLFTTSPDPNGSRGQLNINQTNLAAWSAVLSGVNVVTNGPTGMGSTFIPPAGIYDPQNPTPVARIWQGIVNIRNNTNFLKGSIFPNHTFQHVGDVLSTPELTVKSPFLPLNTVVNDEVYERIPQQIMSLLTLNQSPRFVIYSFGQTLHPAAGNPLVAGGQFNGLCTNYQITAESATRAVVRVEGTSDPKYVDGKVDSLGRSYPPHLVVEQFNVLGPD